MNLEQFAEAMKSQLGQYLAEETEITVSSVRKNNGVMFTGLVIREKESHIAPTIYLEGFYDKYKRGISFSKILHEIVCFYENAKIGECEEWKRFSDYQEVRKRILYKLVNAEKNRELLEEIPYIPYLDLAIVFYYDCSSEQLGNAAVLIRNSHLRVWGIDADTVYRDAARNTPQRKPFEIKTMEDLLKELFTADIRSKMEKKQISFSENWMEEMAVQMVSSEMPAENRTPMYVLTNKDKLHGAACILYQQLLENFAERLKDNLYILPSSIHEIIMIPAVCAGKVSDLRAMVVEINATQVEEEEVLSDSIYFFDRLTKKLQIV